MKLDMIYRSDIFTVVLKYKTRANQKAIERYMLAPLRSVRILHEIILAVKKPRLVQIQPTKSRLCTYASCRAGAEGEAKTCFLQK